MITSIKKQGGQYVFTVGKCKYKCSDYESLAGVRVELLQQRANLKVR